MNKFSYCHLGLDGIVFQLTEGASEIDTRPFLVNRWMRKQRDRAVNSARSFRC